MSKYRGTRWTNKRTYRTSQSAEFPVEDTDDAVLCGMEDEVVELVVAMYDSEPQFFLVREVLAIPRD